MNQRKPPVSDAPAGPTAGAWRTSAGGVLLLLIIGAVLVVAGTFGARALANLLPYARSTPLTAMRGAITAAGAVLAYKAFKRWVERVPDAEFALPGAAGELTLGLVFGFLLVCVATGAVALLGGYEVVGVRGFGEFWAMLSVGIFSGPFEEALFRGVGLRLLEKVVGTGWALVLTAGFFGGAHLMNPNATVFAAGAIAVEAGILLGASYLMTRRLWLAIGVHSAWNFTEGWVFSSPISGGAAPLGLLIARRIGPDWLTGGPFGLEASAPAAAVATIAGLALLWFAYEHGEFVPPRWRQTKL